MWFQRYYLGCLAHASYMIGDPGTQTAAVVDPQRDIDHYLADAEARNLKIRYVLLTHFHADFVAGHLELRARTGATICLGAQAVAEYDFRPLRDGECIEMGSVRLEVLETPGHSPESISIVVFDMANDPSHPYAVLTGDTLFVGDVGRPDLRASLGFSASQLGSLLFDSLHRKLMPLPDETLVYPAHGAGSLCGKSLGTEPYSTIGAQRQYNYALQPMSREDFVQLVTAEQPEAPAYFTYDAVLNTREHPALEATLEERLRPLALEEVLEQVQAGCQLLDVRDPAEFAGAHVRNSLNIGLGGQFAFWAGSVLEPNQPVAVVASPGKEREAMVRLGRIGFDQAAGYLRDGMEAVKHRPDLIGQTHRVTAATLSEQLSSRTPPVVLDVRNEKEHQAKRIEDSLHIPLGRLKKSLSRIPKNRPLVVHCAAGYRSSIAASLLQMEQIGPVSELIGGIAAWEQCQLPLLGDAVARRPDQMKPSDYAEQLLEVGGWKVRLTSYRLGEKYYCKADNVEPGACLTRVEGSSKVEVEEKALAKAREYLSRTRRMQTTEA
ncbi:MAG: MBL fold metallo-hydrolase [Acidobacteriota bacterium]